MSAIFQQLKWIWSIADFPPIGGGGDGPPPNLRGEMLFVAGDGFLDRRPGLYPFSATTVPPNAIPNVLDVPVSTDYLAVEFSPDGARILASDLSGNLELYTFDGLNTSEVPITLGRTTGVIDDIAWHPSGEYFSLSHRTAPYLSTFSFDADTNTVTLLADADVTPNSHNSGVGNLGASGLAYSPDGARLGATGGSSDPHVYFYDFDAGALTKLADPNVLPAHTSRNVAWSPDSRYASVGGATFLEVYDLDSGSPIRNTTMLPTATVSGGAIVGRWSPDGRYVAICYYSTTAAVYDTLSGSPVKATLPVSDTFADCAWSASGDRLFFLDRSLPILVTLDFTDAPASVTDVGDPTYTEDAASGTMTAPTGVFKMTL